MERTITATEFEARCLALLDEIAETGDVIVVTKKGKPVAKLVPFHPERTLKGSVRFLGDIVSPVFDPDDWEANRD